FSRRRGPRRRRRPRRYETTFLGPRLLPRRRSRNQPARNSPYLSGRVIALLGQGRPVALPRPRRPIPGRPRYVRGYSTERRGPLLCASSVPPPGPYLPPCAWSRRRPRREFG